MRTPASATLNPRRSRSVLLLLLSAAVGLVAVFPGGRGTVERASAAGECPASWTYESSTGTCFRSFTTTGATTWTPAAGVTSIDYLVVGGGGGGQGQASCGDSCKGGAGGTVKTGTLTIADSTQVTINVGGGGAPVRVVGA